MIIDNQMPIRIGKCKHTHVITIKKKNKREIKKGTIIKSIILNNTQFPVNNKTRTNGNSQVVTIPHYLIKNKLMTKGTKIDKIEI